MVTAAAATVNGDYGYDGDDGIGVQRDGHAHAQRRSDPFWPLITNALCVFTLSGILGIMRSRDLADANVGLQHTAWRRARLGPLFPPLPACRGTSDNTEMQDPPSMLLGVNTLT